MASEMTYERARQALEAAFAKAKEMSIIVAVAVVDEGGFPVAIGRMDGARGFTSDIAVGKAKASALWGAPSGRLAANVPEPIRQAAARATGGAAVFWQGAVPVKLNGQLIGALGASGSSSENDEIVCQAGADVLQGVAAS